MREYIGRALGWLNPVRLIEDRPATIDTIEPGSIMVSPRKPIDRFDVAAITEVLDLATKIGAVLLDSGTAAIDTQQQIAFVCGVYGLEDVEVDVTYNTIVVSARRGATLPPITTMEQVYYRSMDFTRLAQIDRLVRRIRDMAITPSSAHRMVDEIITAPHPYRHRVATCAWGLMAASISVLLGGAELGAVLAFLTTVVIVVVNRRLNRIGTPVFFQQFTGGFIAVVPAAVTFGLTQNTSINLSPSFVIAAGIVVLLSGLSLVGSVQDAITGAPITGVARFFELLLMTGGLIAGVGIAISLLENAGIFLPTITPTTTFPAVELPVRILAGGLAALAFALASYAEKRALPVAFMSGAIGAAVVASATFVGAIGDVVASALAAALVGLVGGLLARRALTPPLVVAIAGITPLLPGLAVYRALYGLLGDQTLDGITWMMSALGVGAALAAGVTLGEFIARSLRRPQLPVRPAWMSMLRRNRMQGYRRREVAPDVRQRNR
ncbi:threonine/serine exporter family protein [Gordonia sp. LSe1-13]|uniref:Threonine/serine exporter family protein n=1 Tax=Gordonia sesuvii TaxID=3116777 RepID=A0ABU7M9K3_9ACTN|nr:threonine/serine exporter family protein [Gordonia sp. LSe1-13]